MLDGAALEQLDISPEEELELQPEASLSSLEAPSQSPDSDIAAERLAAAEEKLAAQIGALQEQEDKRDVTRARLDARGNLVELFNVTKNESFGMNNADGKKQSILENSAEAARAQTYLEPLWNEKFMTYSNEIDPTSGTVSVVLREYPSGDGGLIIEWETRVYESAELEELDGDSDDSPFLSEPLPPAEVPTLDDPALSIRETTAVTEQQVAEQELTDSFEQRLNMPREVQGNSSETFSEPQTIEHTLSSTPSPFSVAQEPVTMPSAPMDVSVPEPLYVQTQAPLNQFESTQAHNEIDQLFVPGESPVIQPLSHEAQSLVTDRLVVDQPERSDALDESVDIAPPEHHLEVSDISLKPVAEAAPKLETALEINLSNESAVPFVNETPAHSEEIPPFALQLEQEPAAVSVSNIEATIVTDKPAELHIEVRPDEQLMERALSPVDSENQLSTVEVSTAPETRTAERLLSTSPEVTRLPSVEAPQVIATELTKPPLVEFIVNAPDLTQQIESLVQSDVNEVVLIGEEANGEILDATIIRKKGMALEYEFRAAPAEKALAESSVRQRYEGYVWQIEPERESVRPSTEIVIDPGSTVSQASFEIDPTGSSVETETSVSWQRPRPVPADEQRDGRLSRPRPRSQVSTQSIAA